MSVRAEIRHAVWDDMLDAARMARYAESMESHYRTCHTVVRFGLLLSASGSVAAFLNALPHGSQLYFSVAVSVLVAWDFMSDYANKIAVLGSTKRECQELETEWRDLWLDVDSPESTDLDVQRRNRELSRRLGRATIPMDVQVKVDAKKNEICTRDAYKVTEARYVTR